MLALTSPTGKLGSAVLNAILDNNLIPPSNLVICTTTPLTSPTLAPLHALPLTLRHITYTSPSSLRTAYKGCTSLFLVSSPAIEQDYADAPPGHGREATHFAAIDAALAAGVSHIYYTSLAFRGAPSKAGVMRAHARTEAYLGALAEAGKVRVTVLREGLYSESWPLYFGYFFGLRGDARSEVVVGGDGAVSWTSIADMAFATAVILSQDRAKWAGRTVYLSQKATRTLGEIAGTVSRVLGREVRIKVVGREAYETYYVEESGRERLSVEWWSSTYEALEEGECAIEDSTLENILGEVGRVPKGVDETIREMLE
ncbi:NAD(P)-binding protein [Pyrenochaeta sp. DS3sAY3a]|nr:NAD(P)-binding protein [Pyrenochaeta sp. DS3sAY3a]